MKYEASRTAFLLIDPLNDFLSPLGKTWPIVRRVMKDVSLIDNVKEVLTLARAKDLTIVYAPHYRYKPETAPTRKYLHPSQYGQKLLRLFSANGFGGKFYSGLEPREGDLIASEHACSSGFIGTDLHEKLQARGITHLIMAGMLSNTCVESTARSALDLGYDITLLKDCVATWSREDHRAAVDGTYHQIAHEVLTASQLKSHFSEAGVAYA